MFYRRSVLCKLFVSALAFCLTTFYRNRTRTRNSESQKTLNLNDSRHQKDKHNMLMSNALVLYQCWLCQCCYAQPNQNQLQRLFLVFFTYSCCTHTCSIRLCTGNNGMRMEVNRRAFVTYSSKKQSVSGVECSSGKTTRFWLVSRWSFVEQESGGGKSRSGFLWVSVFIKQ